jgi:hypothetical protein
MSTLMLHRFLDICHTSFIWATLFQYLIFHFGDVEMIDFITWCVFDYIARCYNLITYSFYCHGYFRNLAVRSILHGHNPFSNHLPVDSSIYCTSVWSWWFGASFNPSLNRLCSRSLCTGPSFCDLLVPCALTLLCSAQLSCTPDLAMCVLLVIRSSND